MICCSCPRQVHEIGSLIPVQGSTQRRYSPLHPPLRPQHAFAPPLPQNPHTVPPRAPPDPHPDWAHTVKVTTLSPGLTAQGPEYQACRICGYCVDAPITCLFVSLQVSRGSFSPRIWNRTSGQAGSAILLQGLHVLQTPLPL